MNWENILPNDVTKKGLIFKRANSSSHNAFKKKKKNLNIGRRPKQTFLQRRHTDG